MLGRFSSQLDRLDRLLDGLEEIETRALNVVSALEGDEYAEAGLVSFLAEPRVKLSGVAADTGTSPEQVKAISDVIAAIETKTASIKQFIAEKTPPTPA